jgi:FAD/FMN-containing dehydrogenase
MSPRYQWNLLEPLRSLEIIWGNGDKLWSGSGAFRGEKEKDWQTGLVPLQGPGPGQTDFYKFVSAAQGSLGIVTWASVKCEVSPEFRKLFFIPAKELDDVIDFTYKLLRFRFGDELFIMNNTCLAYLLANEPNEAEALRDTLPSWAVIVGITGGQILPRERVEAQENDIRDIARQYGLKMTPTLRLPGWRVARTFLKPRVVLETEIQGGSREILTTLDKTPASSTMYSTADEHQYPTPDIGVYIQPVHQGVGCHCEFILPFGLENRAEMLRVRELFRDASHRLLRQGAFFSRPYGIWANMVYNADARTMMVTRKVKEIFDPNNVMNPGKLCF